MTTYYTDEHEWITVDGDNATVGITAHAAEQLGDIVFVELPETGKTVSKGDDMAVVESVKAASDVFAPVDGEVTAINDDLEGEPAKVNDAPMGDGWFVKLKLSDKSQLEGLMDEAGYNEFIS